MSTPAMAAKTTEAASAEHPAAAHLSSLRLHPRFRSRAEAFEGRRGRPRRTERGAVASVIAAEGRRTFLGGPKLLRIARIAVGHADAMGGIVLPDITRRLVTRMILIVVIAIDPDVVVMPIEIAPSPIRERQI